MTGLYVLSCSALFFTIDRVESEMAVVEWEASGELTDVSASLFSSPPTEGDRWVVKIKQSDQGQSTYSRTSNALKTDRGLLFLPKGCRMQTKDNFSTEIFKQNSR